MMRNKITKKSVLFSWIVPLLDNAFKATGLEPQAGSRYHDRVQAPKLFIAKMMLKI
jgi:hypothetical protein